MHISWDDAGCLCPFGDFFNYAAPAEDPCDYKTLANCQNGFPVQTAGLFDANALRLTDAGYEKDVDAYCFYARRSYRENEQVWLQIVFCFDVMSFHVAYSMAKSCSACHYCLLFHPIE